MRFRTLVLLAIGLAVCLPGCSADEHQHSESVHDSEFAEFGDDSVKEGQSEGTEEDHIEVRDGTLMGGATNLGGKVITATDLPPLRFLYCVSCGYKQAFDQFSSFVKNKYPNIPIEGGNYPPDAWKAYLSQFINFAKMAGIVIIITATNPFAQLGMAEPAILTWAHGNKLSACMMLFMIGNMIEGSLMSTGAFEIYLGETQLWSKIESGRVPGPAELLQMIDSQLELTGKLPSETSFEGIETTKFE